MLSQVRSIYILAVLEMVLQTSSFHFAKAPIHRQSYTTSYVTGHSELHLRRALHESDRFSFTLQAALSLRETTDIIKETVLLSEIAGHYVKDIKPKGTASFMLQNPLEFLVSDGI